jgi:hypothetical protein
MVQISHGTFYANKNGNEKVVANKCIDFSNTPWIKWIANIQMTSKKTAYLLKYINKFSLSKVQRMK